MLLKTKLPVVCLLLCSLLLVYASIASGDTDAELNRRDPQQEYRRCQAQCQHQQETGSKEQCLRQCEEQRRQSEREHGRGRGGGGRNDEFDIENIPNRRDPQQEYQRCQSQCQHQQGRGSQERCLRQCEEQRRQSEREHGRGRGGEGERSDEFDIPNRRDPEQEYRRCQAQCQRQQERGRQESCLRQCEEQLRRSEREGGRGRVGDDNESRWEGEEEEQGQEEYEENPYVFQDEHFSSQFQTQHGRVRTLQRFTDRSRLLRGIENYRVTILEAEPQTFIVPAHWDAETVAFVVRGRGSASLIRSDRKESSNRRESFNIRRGDIIRIPAGTTSYLINRDNNEKLVIAKLHQPVSTPGNFEYFFGAGGENPESFYKAFSNEILEAAFNTKRDRLQRLFGQQRQGIIVKASEDQIRALSHHEEGGIWPFGGESKGTINIFQHRPSQENQYGQLYEVAPEDHRQLEDLNVAISYLNLTQGAMTGPTYSSKATKLALVVNGEGYLEMACPHLGGQHQGRQQARRGSQQQQGAPSYQRVGTRLRRGTLVVIPAGHPVVTVASQNQNLEVICFEVNARNSWKFALAGKNNVINQLERQAKELAFGVPAREVEEVFGSQQEQFFFQGPQQQHEGRAEA